MTDSGTVNSSQPLRLCSEIQLFDLCDLESCRLRNDRFCTDVELLARFEKIADEEPRKPELYISEETEYGEELEDPDEFDSYEGDDCEDFEPEDQ